MDFIQYWLCQLMVNFPAIILQSYRIHLLWCSQAYKSAKLDGYHIQYMIKESHVAPSLTLKSHSLKSSRPLALVKLAHVQRICKTVNIFCFVFWISHLGTSHLQRWTANREGRNESTKLENIHERSFTFPKVTLFRKTVLKKKKTLQFS